MTRKFTDEQLNMLISRVVVKWYKKTYRKTSKSITKRDIQKMRELRKVCFAMVKASQRNSQTTRRFSKY